MVSPREIARAFFVESHDDLEAARLLFDNGHFSKCLEHAQKAVEKALKGALALRGVILAEHQVTETFIAEFADLLSPMQVGRLRGVAEALEGRGTRLEYPFFGRADLPVWVPSQEITQAEAEEGIEHARAVNAIVATLPVELTEATAT